MYVAFMLAFLNNGFPKCKLETCNNQIFKVQPTLPYHFNSFCSKHCQNTYNGIGERNSNYGNTWNNEQRKHLSLIVIDRMKNDYYRYVANQPHSKESIASKKQKLSKFAKTRVKEKNSFYGKHHSQDFCQKQSKRMKAVCNTKEYQIKRRQTCEQNGQMIPLSQKTDYEIYYDLANWKYQMFDIITDEKQLQLLKDNGVFNTQSNTKGCVRDHIYSRFSGFNDKVFPEILRHPCNCQIVLNSYNIRKTSRAKRGPDDQSKEILFDKIKHYDGQWIEQKLCLKLICDYENGKRWVNPYKVNDI